MTNPFSRIHNEKWVIPVSGLSALLGFMIVASWLSESTRNSRYSLLAADQQGRVSANVIDLNKYTALQSEVDILRKRATSLEKALSENGKGSATLNDQLQEAKALAGLTELEGPGVKVVVKDRPNAGPMPLQDDLIHDLDILKITNELFASGAEAISVNGQRLAAMSSIRCAGPTILVDGVRLAAPYTIFAIGDPDTLYGGFTMSGGVMTELVAVSPSMVEIKREKKLRIPAYLGATTRKFATVPKATK